jgi:hypothetical protein
LSPALEASQRRALAVAAYLVAVILFVFWFGRPFWDWATWDASKGTFDFGIVKVTNRPPFPGDARSVLVGLVLPVVVAALGRVLEGPRRPPA